MNVLSENVMNNCVFALLVWRYFRCCAVKIALRRRTYRKQILNVISIHIWKKEISAFLFFHDIMKHTCKHGACANKFKQILLNIEISKLKTFALLFFVRRIHWSPMDCTHKRPEMLSFNVFLIGSLNKLLNIYTCNQWQGILCCPYKNIYTNMLCM